MSATSQNLSSDEESIHECESHTEELTSVSSVLEKKHKLTFEEFVEQHMGEFTQFKNDFETVSMKEFNKLFSRFLKFEETFMGKLVKMHQKSSSRKKRKPTENTGKSGFNKATPVPVAFSKYLDLDAETEMTRPQLVKQLNIKFTEDGFKNDGHVCISSKKIAKMFGVEKDHTFHAKDYHKFIASYYNSSKNTNP